MIVIPWFVRMAFDVTIIAIPFMWVGTHPTLIYSFAEPKNRQMRKRVFEDFPAPEGEAFSMTPEEVKALYARLGFSEHL